jgi:hypothetical protein
LRPASAPGLAIADRTHAQPGARRLGPKPPVDRRQECNLEVIRKPDREYVRGVRWDEVAGGAQRTFNRLKRRRDLRDQLARASSRLHAPPVAHEERVADQFAQPC